MTEGLKIIGNYYWFEYHCLESKDSQDAELWYHSHQKVKILSIADNDGMNLTEKERQEYGQPIGYQAIFEDGFKSTVMEDELFNNKEGFYRPDPPKQEKM